MNIHEKSMDTVTVISQTKSTWLQITHSVS